MKVKKVFFWLVLCWVSTSALVSCQDDDSPNSTNTEQSEPLVLETRVGAVLTTSAAVQVIPSSKEGRYYLHLFTDSEFQTIEGGLDKKMSDLAAANPEKVLQGGQTVIFDELEASANYVACVVAVTTVKTDVKNEVKQLTFTTKAKASEKLNLVFTSLTDWANSEMKGKNEFSMILSEAEVVDNMFVTGRLVRLYGIRPLVEGFMPQNPAFFNGIYKQSESKEEWTVYSGDCRMEIWENREWQETAKIEESEFAISYTDNQLHMIGYFTIEDQVFEIDYVGDVKFTLSGYYGYWGYRPQLEEDKVNLDYTLMKDAAYRAVKDGVGQYTLACVHDPDPDDHNGGFNKDCLRLNLQAPVGKYPLLELPSGTYTIDTAAAPFTPFVALPGDYLRESSIINYLDGCYYYNLNNKTGEQVTGFMRQGTITVCREGEEYIINVDATTHLGHKVSGTYKGKFDITVEGV